MERAKAHVCMPAGLVGSMSVLHFKVDSELIRISSDTAATLHLFREQLLQLFLNKLDAIGSERWRTGQMTPDGGDYLQRSVGH